jgi:hypothetical protein
MDNKQRELEQAAERYRLKDYLVEVRPSGPALPGFLDRFQPDLIARHNGEQVVVLVRSMAELAKQPELIRLAEVVNAEPGWRLDLVVPPPPGRTWDDWVEADESSPADINGLLNEARQLLGLGLFRPALMTAWAAVEAAMRHAARRERLPLQTTSPHLVLDALAEASALSDPDYQRLAEALRWRNVAIHGKQTNGLGAEPTEALLDIARRLLDGTPDEDVDVDAP